MSGYAKALCPFHSSMKVLSPAVDLIPRQLKKKCLLFTYLQNTVILSIIVIVRAGVKCTNVVCPHNRIYDLCIFAIFSRKQVLWT